MTAALSAGAAGAATRASSTVTPSTVTPSTLVSGLPGLTSWWSWLPGLWSLPGLPSGGTSLPGLPSGGTSLPGLPSGGTSLPGLPGGTGGTSGGTGGTSGGTGGTTSPPSSTGLAGTLTTGSYTNASGSRNYELYVPSTYKAGASVPLIVALHGCTQDMDVFRKLTALDALAESKGFIVVFPNQSSSANSQNCWNWYQQSSMQRGSGEPSIIAGITQSIQQKYSVDTKRTYVLGLSAGGAMATVMGATYPDIYAAVGSGSGCEYNGLPCVGSPGPDPAVSGKAAYQAMGSYARSVPVIVFQGDADTTVVPANGDRIVAEWQVTDDWADDSSSNGSIPVSPTAAVTNQVAGGRSSMVTTYGNGKGGSLIQYWVVHGMNHAWSGGCGCEKYSDPSGPNESQAMLDFFLAHPMS